LTDRSHEWLSFADPDEERTWLFDVTFLASSWTCIFGHGCQGVLTGPASELEQGCCSYGAHFSDADDIARVEAAAATLTADQWQFQDRGRRKGIVKQAAGSSMTRLVEDACIFLNRPGFPGGAGCALHRAALERGESPVLVKPDVCWQLPLRREDVTDASTGHVTSTVTEWDRRHWGPAGEEFHWWCTEAPEAFHSSQAVYVAMREELVALVGIKPYEHIARYLDERLTSPSVLLPHPVVRQATT